MEDDFEVPPADAAWARRAREHHDRLTKPPGSLGRLEAVGIRLAAIQRRLPPRVERVRTLVFAADHGVTAAHRVSPYPREVTGQMVANFARGGAAINAIAQAIGGDLHVYDVGVAHPCPVSAEASTLHHHAVAMGTRDCSEDAAMSPSELAEALAIGRRAASRCAAEGIDAIALGEMGIGNTTVASALTAGLLGRPAEAVVGPGTGARGEVLAEKQRVVARALARHGAWLHDPLEALRRIGGLEIAAIVGATLEAARREMAVVSDGFIVTAAVAWAARLAPTVLDYVFAGHRSTEPGHAMLLDHLGLEPLLDLDMRLGEGTGATLAVPLLRAAASVLARMATFESAGVSDRS